jgi:hypothetical protein
MTTARNLKGDDTPGWCATSGISVFEEGKENNGTLMKAMYLFLTDKVKKSYKFIPTIILYLFCAVM